MQHLRYLVEHQMMRILQTFTRIYIDSFDVLQKIEPDIQLLQVIKRINALREARTKSWTLNSQKISQKTEKRNIQNRKKQKDTV